MTAKKRSKRKAQPEAPAPNSTPETGRASIWHQDRILHIGVTAFGVLVCGIASLMMGQDNNWDLRNYHFYNPYAWLNDRIGFDFAPAQRQTFLNPLSDLPFYLGIEHLSPRVLGFLMGGFQGITVGVLFAICFICFRHTERTMRVGLSLACAAMGAYAPIFVGQLGGSNNDTAIGLLILISIFILLRMIASDGRVTGPTSRWWLLSAAALMGFAVGLKLTAMLYAVGTVAAFMVVEANWRSRATVTLLFGSAFLVGFAASNGYWMGKMWSEFGNPFFPFFNDVFKSAWADPRSYADKGLVPGSLWEGLARPFVFAYHSDYITHQNYFRDVRFSVAFLLLVAAAATSVARAAAHKKPRFWLPFRDLSPTHRFLIVFVVVSFVVWEAMFSIIRYAATLEALAPALVVILVHAMLHGRRARLTAVAAAFVLIAVMMQPMQHKRVAWGDEFWQVQLPVVRNPENTVIILANPRPWAYFAPLFPPGIRWINVNSNLTNSKSATRMQAEIRELLASFDGDMYLLSRAEPEGWLEHDQRALAAYRLAVGIDLGQPVISKHSRDRMFLWPVRRY